MTLVLLRILGLVLSGYPIAAACQLPWARRLPAATAVGFVGGAGITWLTGCFVPGVRPDLPVWLFATAGAVLLIRDIRRNRPTLRPDPGALGLGALAVVLAGCQLILVATSGWRTQGLFLAAHHSRDALVHLAISAVLRPDDAFSTPWPPPLPLFGDRQLWNYHPLSDVLVALVAPHDQQVTAYFRFLPVVYCLLLVGAVYWVLSEWGFGRRVQALGAALTVLCGSLGNLVHLFGTASDPYWESHFWMSQPFSMLYNPPFALSLGVLMVGLALLSRWQERPLATVVALGALWGLGFALKAFMTIVVGPGLFFAFLFAAKSERKWLFLMNVSVASAAAVIMLSTTRAAQGALAVKLGWPLSMLPERLNMVSPLTWEGPHFIGWIWLAVLFVAGNFGVRAVGFVDLVRALWRGSGPVATAKRVAAFASVLAIAMPMVFETPGVHWNTIQFGYYALALTPLFAAPRLADWIGRAPIWGKVVIGVAVLGLALPTTVQSLRWIRFGTVIPAEEVAALRALKARVPPGGLVLISPVFIPGRPQLGYSGFSAPQDASGSTYVPALSARPAYLADRMALDVLRIDHQHRFGELNILFAESSPERIQAFCAERKISGVYWPPGTHQP